MAVSPTAIPHCAPLHVPSSPPRRGAHLRDGAAVQDRLSGCDGGWMGSDGDSGRLPACCWQVEQQGPGAVLVQAERRLGLQRRRWSAWISCVHSLLLLLLSWISFIMDIIDNNNKECVHDHVQLFIVVVVALSLQALLARLLRVCASARLLMIVHTPRFCEGALLLEATGLIITLLEGPVR